MSVNFEFIEMLTHLKINECKSEIIPISFMLLVILSSCRLKFLYCLNLYSMMPSMVDKQKEQLPSSTSSSCLLTCQPSQLYPQGCSLIMSNIYKVSHVLRAFCDSCFLSSFKKCHQDPTNLVSFNHTLFSRI